eukprot:403376718
MKLRNGPQESPNILNSLNTSVFDRCQTINMTVEELISNEDVKHEMNKIKQKNSPKNQRQYKIKMFDRRKSRQIMEFMLKSEEDSSNKKISKIFQIQKRRDRNAIINELQEQGRYQKQKEEEKINNYQEKHISSQSQNPYILRTDSITSKQPQNYQNKSIDRKLKKQSKANIYNDDYNFQDYCIAKIKKEQEFEKQQEVSPPQQQDELLIESLDFDSYQNYKDYKHSIQKSRKNKIIKAGQEQQKILKPTSQQKQISENPKQLKKAAKKEFYPISSREAAKGKQTKQEQNKLNFVKAKFHSVRGFIDILSNKISTKKRKSQNQEIGQQDKLP